MGLADDVIGMAGQAVQSQGHTVGDALQAYHVAATAEHASQELQMEQQKQSLNKANWIAQQYDKIGRTTGPAQGIMIDSFGKQMQQIEPGFNPDILTVLKKDPDILRNQVIAAGRTLSRGGISDPQSADALLAMHNGDLGEYVNSATKIGEQNAQISAAQLKNQAMEGRVGAMQDTATQHAGDIFDKDPNILKLTPMGQSLGRDMKTLSNSSPDHPVTYQTLHESLMNVASVLGSGSLSDARIGSITPPASDETAKKIDSFFSNDPNQEADPEYIKYVQNLVNRLHGAVKSDVSDRADTLYAGRDQAQFHNPAIKQVLDQKHSYLKSGQWASPDPGQSGGDQPQASGGQPQFRQDVMDYAQKHNITPAQADQIRIQRGG